MKRAPIEDPEPEAATGTPAGATKKAPKKRKLSNRRVNIILATLRLALDRAVKRGWLEANPAREVATLREEKPEVLPFSLDEVRLFLDNGLQDAAWRRYTPAWSAAQRHAPTYPHLWISCVKPYRREHHELCKARLRSPPCSVD